MVPVLLKIFQFEVYAPNVCVIDWIGLLYWIHNIHQDRSTNLPLHTLERPWQRNVRTYFKNQPDRSAPVGQHVYNKVLFGQHDSSKPQTIRIANA